MVLEVFLSQGEQVLKNLDANRKAGYQVSVYRRACIVVSRYGAAYLDGGTSERDKRAVLGFLKKCKDRVGEGSEFEKQIGNMEDCIERVTKNGKNGKRKY
jgi:hypothetical protein